MANLLTTRKTTVTVVEKSGEAVVIDSLDENQEIEELIVEHLSKQHSLFINSAEKKSFCCS